MVLMLAAWACHGQEKLVIGMSERVIFDGSSEYEAVDSLVFVVDRGRSCVCDHIEVYFDVEMQHLAYQSFERNDSCTTIDYWRSGAVKKYTTYLKAENDMPLWWYTEYYCSNGQLIFKGPSPNQPQRKHYVNYYCNGNKMNAFDHVGMAADGQMTWWYENGNLMSVFFFEDGRQVGDWTYYHEDGKLQKIERYANGERVETIEY